MTRDEIKALRGLLFDKDGTLFGFQESWAPAFAQLLDWLAAEGVDAPAAAKAIGFDLAAARFAPHSPVIAGTPEDLSALLAPHLTPAAGALEGMLDAWAETITMAPVTDLSALTAMLRGAGFTLGVATNDAEAAARAHLGPVAGAFDFFAGSDSGHGAKPDPGMITAFVTASGHAPHQIAMIGDSLHDLRAAASAGVRKIAVLTGVATADALAPYADVVLNSIAELPGLLEVG
ncbi:MAG: HAD family hydrolase [Pseudomonadota bacterium]